MVDGPATLFVVAVVIVVIAAYISFLLFDIFLFHCGNASFSFSFSSWPFVLHFGITFHAFSYRIADILMYIHRNGKRQKNEKMSRIDKKKNVNANSKRTKNRKKHTHTEQNGKCKRAKK